MGKILFTQQDGVQILKFEGDVRLTLGPTISAFLEKLQASEDFKSMVIDLSDTETIDSTALGLIAKIAICTSEQFGSATSIVSPREDITRVLQSMAMEQVCVVTREPVTEMTDLRELPTEIAGEAVMRDQVLDAHKTLMTLNDRNRDEFRDLVDALESEKSNEETAEKTPLPKRATGC